MHCENAPRIGPCPGPSDERRNDFPKGHTRMYVVRDRAGRTGQDVSYSSPTRVTDTAPLHGLAGVGGAEGRLSRRPAAGGGQPTEEGPCPRPI